ncbi:TrkH family potassium uptake protein [Halorussus salinisoli]|uniref:TrkH family potassium uptake protein n=1 Tax=Halorussus salinisoli TaxID=2558242 RepID=UPI0010C19857|nr:TrkH family potassium uptake protein [Halorussus salinisoli]
MVEFEALSRDVGRILQALSGLMFVSIFVSVVWGEYYAVPGLLISGGITLVVGSALTRIVSEEVEIGKLHGMIIAASGWFLVAVFGSLPFYLIALTVRSNPAVLATPELTPTLDAFTNPLNALFESMSGFTGTGLTMTDDESVLPHTLQWWRSFSEWVGGVGVIVLTTAILARPGSGSLTLYESEAREEKIHPSIVSTVHTIWWIFLLFTFLSITLLWLAGMPIWHAINHGMTGLSTGGFSVTDGSIGAYDSVVIDFTLVPVMILGGIAFPVHYLVLQGELRNFYTDLQTRWFFVFLALGSGVLTSLLVITGVYDSEFEAFRYGLFQFVSALSCTGFQTAGRLGPAWPAEAQLAIAFAMSIGAAAGSTVGGIKLIRVATFFKGTLYRIQGVFYPDTVIRRFELDGRKLSDEEASREIEEAAIISFLWVVFLSVGTVVLLLVVPSGPNQFTLENVIFEVTSAQGNVGLSAGITGPEMPTPAKVMFLFNMWIGRLEIIPVLVLIRSLFETFDGYS